MKKFIVLGLLAVGFAAAAVDKLAIAEPKVSESAFTRDDAQAVWDLLEESVKSPDYELVSRAALQQMMTEIGLVTSSDLVDPTSDQKAKLGRVKGVDYLLVSSLRKLGNTMILTLKVLNASTGVILSNRTAVLKKRSLDEIAEALPLAVKDLLANEAGKALALLAPEIQTPNAPSFLESDFSTWVQTALVANKIDLASLNDVRRFQKAGLTQMSEAEYVTLGAELRVKYLVRTVITGFAVVATPWSSPETGAYGYDVVGNMEGTVTVINANDGKMKDVIPVQVALPLGKFNGPVPSSFGPAFGKMVVAEAVNRQILPRLAVLEGLR